MGEARWPRDRRIQDEAFGDAVYDVWMSGGNPDVVSRDDISEAYYNEGAYDRHDTADVVTRRTMQQNNQGSEVQGE